MKPLLLLALMVPDAIICFGQPGKKAQHHETHATLFYYNISEYDTAVFEPSVTPFSSFRIVHTPARDGQYIVYGGFADKPVIRGIFTVNGGVVTNKQSLKEPLENLTLNKNPCIAESVYIHNQVAAYAYKREEISKPIIISFPKNNSFKSPLKTYAGHPGLVNDYYIEQQILTAYWHLSSACDYEIILQNNDTFRISDITTAHYNTTDNKSVFCTMVSYRVNDKLVYGNSIILIKPGKESEYKNFIDQRNHRT